MPSKYYVTKTQIVRASPLVSPNKPPTGYFPTRTAKNGSAAPPVPRFPRIWAFIHPASPRQPRPTGARSGSPDEAIARETPRNLSRAFASATPQRWTPAG
jgi:hypothetical protein